MCLPHSASEHKILQISLNEGYCHMLELQGTHLAWRAMTEVPGAKPRTDTRDPLRTETLNSQCNSIKESLQMTLILCPRCSVREGGVC
jgi:hypothetical protein